MEIEIDIEELRRDKAKNFKERLQWIDLWADYMKKTPNKVWSAQQKKVIDYQLTKAEQK
jgi:hypothetical protein